MQSLKSADRIQAVLEHWFAVSSWDRASKPPGHLMLRWFGMRIDPSNGSFSPASKEEQEAVDREIRENFLSDLKLSAIKDETGYFNSWRQDPQGLLALLILQDQCSRNIFRKQAEAFSFGELAQELILGLIENRGDKNYKFYERLFLYMPLEHSESLELQDLSLKMYQELTSDFQSNEFLKAVASRFLSFAEEHHKIVKRFGRFPHRNEVLGRKSTEEETKFLAEGGSRFNQ